MRPSLHGGHRHCSWSVLMTAMLITARHLFLFGVLYAVRVSTCEEVAVAEKRERQNEELHWHCRRWPQHGSKLGWFPEAALWASLGFLRWTGPLLTWPAPTGQQIAPHLSNTPDIPEGKRTRMLLPSYFGHILTQYSQHSQQLTHGIVRGANLSAMQRRKHCECTFNHVNSRACIQTGH